jgi:hypothetical protein
MHQTNDTFFVFKLFYLFLKKNYFHQIEFILNTTRMENKIILNKNFNIKLCDYFDNNMRYLVDIYQFIDLSSFNSLIVVSFTLSS